MGCCTESDSVSTRNQSVPETKFEIERRKENEIRGIKIEERGVVND